MSTEAKIGQLVIDLKIKTEALEKGLETAKKKIKEIEESNNELENSNKKLDSSFLAMSATAIAVLVGIKNAVNSATEEYKTHIQAMSSLQDVSEYTGESIDDLSSVMQKYENVITKSDLATTIKNFTLMGYSAKETDAMIESLTNSAIKNRNANYTVSEAVKVASEGYRQGLSTLSDSAGVTENLSVMLDKYAESIGKTASQLTETEKNQAYLNRTISAAEPFVGAMSEYLDTLAGKQGEYSKAMLETQIVYTEALEPTLIRFEELKTKLISGLGEIINKNQEATAGVTAFVATLATFLVSIIAIKKGIDLYKNSVLSASTANRGFMATITANPIGATATAISLVVSGLAAFTAATEAQKQKQQELNEIQQKHNEIMRGTIELNNENVTTIQTTKKEIEAYIDKLKEYQDGETTLAYMNKLGAPQGMESEYNEAMDEIVNENIVLASELSKTSDKFAEQFDIIEDGWISVEKMTDILEVYNKRLAEAEAKEKIKNATDIESIKTQQKEAAQLKVNANQMQSYLNILKKGDKSTSEYQNAVKQLAKAYPEAANAEGIIIEQAQNFIDAEKGKAEQAWTTSQNTINANIATINSFIQLAQAAENDKVKQAELAKTIGISYSSIIPTLSSVLKVLQLIGGYAPEEVPNITPTTTSYTPKTSSSKSYSNTKLENYKKEIEYKKSLDKISVQQEIEMYETALKKYAKTTDEKRELRTKIYELNKELAQKEKEVLNQQTEDYEEYMQKQKNLKGAAYDINEQEKDYNKIIAMHNKYLKQIMKDERLSLEERKEIYREEIEIIRGYEQQKRDLRVEQIDNTVTQLTNAITKQLEEMQEEEKKIIDENLKAIEEWKNARINAINEEYDARIEAINNELEALSKAEKEKSRAEEDAEFESKKQRLEELVAYEHDAITKANYQKELNKLIEEYQKTLDSRALEDKKENLNEQKKLLQEEQDKQVQIIEDEVEKQREIYNEQLENLEKYYEEQIEKAQETAEKMLLNVEENQNQILNLLKSYGDAYEITGQTLGEKLAQGINEGIASKIEDIIQKIQDSIDTGIENKIKSLISNGYSYNISENKPITPNVNVTQINNIQQTPEMPSETYRKLNTISQKLAEEIVG